MKEEEEEKSKQKGNVRRGGLYGTASRRPAGTDGWSGEAVSA